MDLFGELGKDKSLGENKGLKVEKEKTKRMKQKKVKEISNGNNVNDACQNKILKKPKHKLKTIKQQYNMVGTSHSK